MKREILTGFALGVLIAAVFWAFSRELPRRAQADLEVDYTPTAVAEKAPQ